jgi:hypothetical protein
LRAATGRWLDGGASAGRNGPPRTTGAVMQRAAADDLEHAARQRDAAPSRAGHPTQGLPLSLRLL